ncbi:SHOCT domain-containing protein [Amaricoccus tamworthensis]|uniref:SHOCT domain-containing protein n=1 Tax=Amaricoccus tamworthensis TaxID=57002 RepID=UPI003C7BF03E
MEPTKEGLRLADEVAQRHGVSTDAVVTLMRSLASGGGTQAQFSHPELGGMGQWSLSGMTMVGDMFNNALKAKVDALCTDLSQVVREAGVFRPSGPTTQGQTQSGGQPGVSLFISGGNWWPEELGAPSSSGSQNDLRYAFFPSTRRLAVEVGGQMTVYDTADHMISGVSQQQSGDQSLTFTSQFGLVRLADLKIVDAQGDANDEPEVVSTATVADVPTDVTAPAPATPQETPSRSDEEDVFAKLERIASLHQKGILTDSEFESKKAELLARI